MSRKPSTRSPPGLPPRPPLPSFAGLKALLAFARSGSLPAAAEALDTYPANIGRRIRELEAQTGTKLLQGSRPRLSCTPRAIGLAEATSRALALLEETILELMNDAAGPQGPAAANLRPEVGRLPYFTQLKALESFARLGSFTAAASELQCIPSAVGRNIRLMEAWSGVGLIEGQRRAARMTDQGLRLAAAAAVAFDHIQEAAGDAAPLAPAP